jgi:CBS domain-containing protein
MAQKVRDVMHPGAETVRPGDTVKRAASLMQAVDVGPLPVCDGDRLVGMITDRDITVRATSISLDPATTHVADVMTPGVAFCFEDQDVTEAAVIMKEKQIRRLPVLDRNKQLVGIVSLGDLAVQTGDDALSGETLERVSEPAHPR